MPRSIVLTLALAGACTLGTEPDLGGMPVHDLSRTGNLTLTASATTRADSVVVWVMVENRGSSPGEMEYGACSFAIHAVGPSGQTWGNRLPPNAACIDVGLLLPVPAGAARERVVFRASSAQLREQAGPGTYEISVYYRERGRSGLTRLKAGRITI